MSVNSRKRKQNQIYTFDQRASVSCLNFDVLNVGGHELTPSLQFSRRSLSAKIWCRKSVQITTLDTTTVPNASKLECEYNMTLVFRNILSNKEE